MPVGLIFLNLARSVHKRVHFAQSYFASSARAIRARESGIPQGHPLEVEIFQIPCSEYFCLRSRQTQDKIIRAYEQTSLAHGDVSSFE